MPSKQKRCAGDCLSSANVYDVEGAAELSSTDALLLWSVCVGRKPKDDEPRSGVYVLELATPGCYYVGKSENVAARMRQHTEGSGSCAALPEMPSASFAAP